MANAWWMQTQRTTTAAIEAAERFAAKEAALDALIAAGPGGGANYLHQATLLLDGDQVRALPVTAVTIPGTSHGAGKISLLSGVYWHCNWVADFAGIGSNASLVIRYAGGSAVSASISEALNQVSALLAGGGSDGTTVYTPARFSGSVASAPGNVSMFGTFPEYDSDVVDKAFRVVGVNDASAPFTGGSTSSLRVTAEYRVWDFATGLLVAA